MLEELVADILDDFTNEEGESLIPEEYAQRAAERALPLVATDLDIAYELSGNDVTPEMSGAHRELWLLRSKIGICRFLRSQAASRISFSSGDKRMDRSKEASNWAALEKDLVGEYASRIKRINPAADDSVLSPNARPVIYSRGSQLGD